MNKPIFFMHITKTGGKTIEELLRRNYDKVFLLKHDTDYESLPQDYDVYMGQTAHYTRDLINKDVFSVVFVRDPIKRLVSFYNYYKVGMFDEVQWVHADGTIENYKIRSDLPLIEFFSQDAIELVCYNRMTRDFGGKEPLFQQENMDKVYERALKTVDSFDFIGIFEQFNESVNRLGKLLGKEFEDLHINRVEKVKEEITDEELEFLKEYTKYDYLIYDKCIEKFYQ